MAAAGQEYRSYSSNEINENNQEMSFPAPPPPIDTAMLYSTQSYKPIPKSSMRSTKPFSVSNIGSNGNRQMPVQNNKNEMSEVIAAVAKKGQAMSERNKLAYGNSENTSTYDNSIPNNNEMINLNTPRGFYGSNKTPQTFNAQPVTSNSVYKPVKAYQPNKQLEQTSENQAYKSLQSSHNLGHGAPIQATVHLQQSVPEGKVQSSTSFAPNQPVPSPFKQVEYSSNKESNINSPYQTPSKTTATVTRPIKSAPVSHTYTSENTVSKEKSFDTSKLEDKLAELSMGLKMSTDSNKNGQLAAFKAYTYKPNGKPFEVNNNSSSKDIERKPQTVINGPKCNNDLYEISQANKGITSNVYIPNVGATKEVTQNAQRNTNLFGASANPITITPSIQGEKYQNVGATKEVSQNAQRNANLFGASAAPITKTPSTQGEKALNDLTQALITSMDTPKEPNFAGVCHKCNQSIVGHSQCCTAMEKTYHVNCFTCDQCDGHLQGKSFFSLDGKPHCESCYIKTLEKCTTCCLPITDRILRATGNAYHPDCFVCTVCERSLDGIPFTVDNDSMIYCIDDFHAKFAPRCDVCQQSIKPESGSEETIRIVAMDRSYHVDCYRCQDCSVSLASDVPEGSGCYPLDENILCKSCNSRRVQKITTDL